MNRLGEGLAILSLLLTALTALLSLAGAAGPRRDWIGRSVSAMRATAWVNLAMALLLVMAFVGHDFANRYVASYSDRGMPLVYLLTAFWGGEKGALLFWVVVLSLLGVAVGRGRTREVEPGFGVAHGVIALALLFFDILMVWASSPFEAFAHMAPSEGNGLNPLLQNPLMAIHPPLQLAGFVAYTIPFAYGIADVVTGRTDGRWYAQSHGFNLLAWILTTGGLVIGSVWAYWELGWGGFWGWDPVENAGLLPWITGTALLHSGAVGRRRGVFPRYNLVLVFLTFWLTVFGTFLTRSQLIDSLHSFSNSLLAPYFLVYLAVILVVCVGVLAWRWRRLGAVAKRVGSWWSREAFVMANSVLFLLLAFVVLWGTLLPRISESARVQGGLNAVIDLLNGALGTHFLPLTHAVAVGPAWFNRVAAPLGILLLALTALGPLTSWRSNRGPAVLRAWRTTGWVALGLSAIAWGLRALVLVLTNRDGAADVGWFALMAVFWAAWVVCAVTWDVWRSQRVRRAVTHEAPATALCRLVAANPGRYGGHLVHLGVAVMIVGIAGGTGRVGATDVTLLPGETLRLEDEQVVLLGTREHLLPDGSGVAMKAGLLIYEDGARWTPEVIAGVGSVVGPSVTVSEGDPPFLNLRFPDANRARAFVAKTRLEAIGHGHLVPLAADATSRELVIGLVDGAILEVMPRVFHRWLAQIREFVAHTGEDWYRLEVGRGEPHFRVEALTPDAWDALASFDAVPVPVVAVAREVAGDATLVQAIPEGAGRVMWPEVRRYARFAGTTSEVAIDAGLWSDLYVAAAPAERSAAVSVSVWRNPLMSLLWAGMLIMILSASWILLAMRCRGREGGA